MARSVGGFAPIISSFSDELAYVDHLASEERLASTDIELKRSMTKTPGRNRLHLQ